MDKEDARKQTLLALHTRRKQVVRLHRKGLGVMQIVQLSGLRWPAVRAALTLFEQGGWNALKPRGKESGTGREPVKRAYEQKPEAVQAWLDAQYPAIEARAKAEGAEIHWGDETAIVNTDVRGRCYAPRGQTPVAYAVGGTRHVGDFYRHQSGQGALDDH